MSISSLTNTIERTQRELASLQAKLSQASKKESDASRKLSQVQRSMSGKLSPTRFESKLREVARIQGDMAKAQKEQADLNKRIADKTHNLHKNKADLAKEEERERKKVQALDKRRRKEMADYSRNLETQLTAQRALIAENTGSPVLGAGMDLTKQFDLFISHASEDKDEFVRPLADALKSLGVDVWYDEFQLKVGDSLRRSIDKGLANTRFGVVVLSSAFFAKNWPQYELDGLVAREMNGTKVILPIWHRVTKDEVMKFSPTLADRVALNSSIKSIHEIAAELASVALDGKTE